MPREDKVQYIIHKYNTYLYSIPILFTLTLSDITGSSGQAPLPAISQYIIVA